MMQSAERVSHADQSDNFVFQRSLLAYRRAAELVGGRVLEIGTGSGYGIEIIAPHAETFTTIDKFDCRSDLSAYPNVEFRRMNVPPLTGIESGSMDYVISFQVIEHIRCDRDFLNDIHRVLRPGGKLIITTPNKAMSLTRNPWHIREYTPVEFSALLGGIFSSVEALGVTGNREVMDYYEKNRQAVGKIKRMDIFGVMNWAPRFLLRLPYDLANRLNRRRLLNQNRELTTGISADDYRIEPVNDTCFDLFYIARK